MPPRVTWTTRRIEEWSEVTPAGCWEWTGSRKAPGSYGIASVDARIVPAHRLSWSLSNGPVPPGLWVLHRCDNPPCVNPAHLYAGTRADNLRDMVERGRSHAPRPKPTEAILRGAAHGRAKLSEDDVLRISTLRGRARQVDIAREYGATQTVISRIQLGLSWSTVPRPHAKSARGLTSSERVIFRPGDRH